MDKKQGIDNKNSNIFGQIGQAGNDLIQFTGQYFHYIYNDASNGNWVKVLLALIPAFIFFYGVKEVGVKTIKTYNSIAKNESPVSQAPPSSNKVSHQINNYLPSELQFIQDSCGDKSDDFDKTHYAVFINRGNLDDIRKEYCKNAVQVTRENGEKAVQLAVFRYKDKALRLAKIVDGEVGNVITQSTNYSNLILGKWYGESTYELEDENKNQSNFDIKHTKPYATLKGISQYFSNKNYNFQGELSYVVNFNEEGRFKKVNLTYAFYLTGNWSIADNELIVTINDNTFLLKSAFIDGKKIAPEYAQRLNEVAKSIIPKGLTGSSKIISLTSSKMQIESDGKVSTYDKR